MASPSLASAPNPGFAVRDPDYNSLSRYAILGVIRIRDTAGTAAPQFYGTRTSVTSGFPIHETGVSGTDGDWYPGTDTLEWYREIQPSNLLGTSVPLASGYQLVSGIQLRFTVVPRYHWYRGTSWYRESNGVRRLVPRCQLASRSERCSNTPLPPDPPGSCRGLPIIGKSDLKLVTEREIKKEKII